MYGNDFRRENNEYKRNSQTSIQKMGSLQKKGRQDIGAKIEKRIKEQLKRVRQITEKAAGQISKQKQKEKGLIHQLRQIEEKLRRKAILMRQIETQIQILKKCKVQSRAIGDMCEEFKANTQRISLLMKQIKEKRKMYIEVKEEVRASFQMYSTKCKSQFRPIVTFHQFRQQYEKNKKKQQKSRGKRKEEYKQFQFSPRGPQFGSKQKYYNYMDVANAALKSQIKKHSGEMKEKNSKLDLLRLEQATLNEKIIKKQEELKGLELKILGESKLKPSISISQRKYVPRSKTQE